MPKSTDAQPANWRMSDVKVERQSHRVTRETSGNHALSGMPAHRLHSLRIALSLSSGGHHKCKPVTHCTRTAQRYGHACQAAASPYWKVHPFNGKSAHRLDTATHEVGSRVMSPAAPRRRIIVLQVGAAQRQQQHLLVQQRPPAPFALLSRQPGALPRLKPRHAQCRSAQLYLLRSPKRQKSTPAKTNRRECWGLTLHSSWLCTREWKRK